MDCTDQDVNTNVLVIRRRNVTLSQEIVPLIPQIRHRYVHLVSLWSAKYDCYVDLKKCFFFFFWKCIMKCSETTFFYILVKKAS